MLRGYCQKGNRNHILSKQGEQCCLWKAMLLLLKCFDIKKVNSSKDLIIIDWVLGGEPTTTKKK